MRTSLRLALHAFTVLLLASTARAQEGTIFPPDESRPPAAPPSQSADSAPAPAEPPAPPFGARGEVVVTGSAYGAVSATQWDSSAASSLSFGLGPSAHWFVAPNLSLGFDFEISYSDGKGYGADGSLVETKSTLVSGGPVIGYNVPLGARFSFWPHVILGVHYGRQTQTLVSGGSFSVAGNPTGSPDTTEAGPWLDLYAPILFHPKPHLFLGFGPDLYHDFARVIGGPDVGAERTRLGAGFVLGGWWGGPRIREEMAAESPSPGRSGEEPRFGDAHQVVLTSELELGGGYTSFAGTDSSAASFAIAPGFDDFVAPHFSLGAVASYRRSATRGVGSGGAEVTYDYSSWQVGPRIGVDIPLVSGVSLYPRASLLVGGQDYNETSSGQTNKANVISASGALSAPLLLHVASHFFLGFGPEVWRDLTRTTATGYSYPGTTLGASFLAGGWL